jgi:lipoprotein-releasing system permease protein
VGIGDKLTFVAPEVSVTPAGMFPRMKRFTVVGIFHVGAGEIDGYLGLTNLQDLARLHRWKPDQVQGLRLKFDDLFQAPRVPGPSPSSWAKTITTPATGPVPTATCTRRSAWKKP